MDGVDRKANETPTREASVASEGQVVVTLHYGHPCIYAKHSGRICSPWSQFKTGIALSNPQGDMTDYGTREWEPGLVAPRL